MSRMEKTNSLFSSGQFAARMVTYASFPAIVPSVSPTYALQETPSALGISVSRKYCTWGSVVEKVSSSNRSFSWNASNVSSGLAS